MTFTTNLVQTSLTTADFLVGSNTDVPIGRYDIRVRSFKQSTIGIKEVRSNGEMYAPSLTITAKPHTFTIPLSSEFSSGVGVDLVNGETYLVTITLYGVPTVVQGESQEAVLHVARGVVYYDARDITVNPVDIANNPNPGYSFGSTPNFSHSTPIMKVGGAVMPSTDSFYKHIQLDKIKLTATELTQDSDGFVPGNDHYLGIKSYAPATTYIWDNTLPYDRAYECWGALTLVPATTFTVSDTTIIKPTFSFAYEFYSTDNIGYRLAPASITLALGDVVGQVSLQPIRVQLNNFDSYINYKFDTVTLKVNASASATTPIFTITKNYADIVDNALIVTNTELASYVNGNGSPSLINGVNYYFQLVLNFTNGSLYVPSQYKSVEAQGEFSDRIDPVSVAEVENSWMYSSESAASQGLVVKVQKTTQFIGNLDVAYNLDMYGETTILVEYNVLDASNNRTNWLPFSGGSIAQGTVNYSLNSANTDGSYVVPKDASSNRAGAEQGYLHIFSVIPNQTHHRLIQFRVSLRTDNSNFKTENRTSNQRIIHLSMISHSLTELMLAAMR